MQKITTFLTFNDQAEEAVKLYTSVFKNSKILSTTRYGDAGPGVKGSLVTANFELEGQEFVALNGGPSFNFSQGISLFVGCDTQQEVDAFWEKLSEVGSCDVEARSLRHRRRERRRHRDISHLRDALLLSRARARRWRWVARGHGQPDALRPYARAGRRSAPGPQAHRSQGREARYIDGRVKSPWSGVEPEAQRVST